MNQQKRLAKLVDSRIFLVHGGNFKRSHLHLDPVLYHFKAEANIVEMAVISVGSLIAWFVATLLISSSNIDIFTEKKPFSLLLYHDRSIIVAVISSLVGRLSRSIVCDE